MADAVHRPRRVIILDADDPLVEVQGEFFWTEDHLRILGEQRDHAYREGFSAGFDAGAARAPVSLVVRRRRGVLRRVGRGAFALFWVLMIVLFLAELLAR